MLVTFTCKNHENVVFFFFLSKRLLHLMGHSGTVPGAILAQDVPAALHSLEKAMIKEKQKPLVVSDDEGEPEVSLVHRALPLIALLQDAVKQHCNVMWA